MNVGKRRLALLSLSLLILAFASSLANAGDSRSSRPRKVADDNENLYTDVGNIGLTVTNFGTIGDRNAYWPSQPSCQYPRGSGIEHIYQGALWVGALVKSKNPHRNGNIYVTTGSSDQASGSTIGGVDVEFTNAIGANIFQRSLLTVGRPASSAYSALAISDQDFICDYTDTNTHVPETGDSILDHNPLGIAVHQESYAWNASFANFFVILQYTIKNVGPDTLDSVYVGFWNNAVVHNTNLVEPGTVGYYDYTGQGFDSTVRMAYAFDFNGEPDPPPADSYVGLKLLGSMPFPSGVDSIGGLHYDTYFNAWQYRLSAGTPAYTSPKLDYDANNPYDSKYNRLAQSMPQSAIAPLRTLGVQDVSILLSTGPYSRLNPGDTIQIAFAVVCAKKYGGQPASLDLPLQRQTLYANAKWAQQCYQGDDVDGLDTLLVGQNIAVRDSESPTEYGLRYTPDPYNRITRYLLPAPPREPKARVQVENQAVILYWDKSTAELTIDPISHTYNFEGYRIYGSTLGQDIYDNSNLYLDLSLLGDFDVAGDGIGRNTGFSLIQLPKARYFPGDTVSYWYRFPPAGQAVPSLNGWQYVYSITSYSKGDSATGVPSLESAEATFRAVPGTPPNTHDSATVSVYPNPYYVNATWDGKGDMLRKIYFCNLPPLCQIVVYTLAGDVVTVINHNAATYHGQGIQWFTTYGDPSTQTQFSGGEHAWDLITRNDQAIATGLYLYTVKDLSNGKIQRGKFLIVK
jgi:hypothetical protein